MPAAAKSIHVSMAEFRITVADDGVVTRVIGDCGFGRAQGPNNLTPIIGKGRLSSWKRKADYKSSTYPKPGGGAPMNFALFIEDNLAIAFHEGSTKLESHGCIHLNRTDAKWLFEWAADSPVDLVIEGPHPSPGVRAMTYKVSQNNMLPRVVAAIVSVLNEGGFLDNLDYPDYDSTVAAAVEQYQRTHGLGVDGKVGSETALHMGVSL